MHTSIHQKSRDNAKADFDAIKRELCAENWEELFQGQTVEQSWSALRDKIEKLEEKYIPVKQQTSKKKKPIWMTYKALKTVQHRCQIYNKYKDIKHPAYVRAAKAANTLVKTG